MQNLEYRRGTIHFAELETGGKRVECPTCHAPFKPHLGNLIAARFQCESCKSNITFRSTNGRTVICPCCRFSRPAPILNTLVCDGCAATVIYRKDDPTVKCFQCKHITISPEANYQISQVNPVVPPQVNRVVPPQVNRVIPPPQVNRIVPPQVNRVVPPSQVNRVIPPPQVNRIVPPQVNRMNRTATAETESTATSSAHESLHTNLDEYPDSVAQLIRNVALGNGTIKREVEEDKTEAKSKKIRL
ncbi:hypothetical protein EUTSA_v10009449mg [Eutrema salsugineum]|uniref:Zinc finger LSD1-type domain-containing protein n=1 Tax=Eutrema salsugineum TaxID=72664 RepID=V4L1Z9_EUTSA|nr:hypothetical protein EUTSA_v10009449mg [Eutrema salsugineum]